MIIKRQYLDYEKSNGFIMTKVLNPSYANDTIPFDVFEAVHNPGESGALFIPTRVMVTRNQGQKGSCENPGYPCDSDEDCDTGDDMSTGKCSNSMCVRRGWCPSETVRTPGTEVYKIDASSYDLWFQGRVLYHKFRADVGNTEDPSPIFYPNENANTYPMRHLADGRGRRGRYLEGRRDHPCFRALRLRFVEGFLRDHDRVRRGGHGYRLQLQARELLRGGWRAEARLVLVLRNTFDYLLDWARFPAVHRAGGSATLPGHCAFGMCSKRGGFLLAIDRA